MGKNKGGWRKFFCCTGPPETQSSTCINIASSEQFKPPSEPDPSEPDPSEPEPDQEPEDNLYLETEVQTSKVEVPEGNRWRWSRLHKEVEQQTSISSVLVPEIESSSEADVQVQTSFSSIPRGREAQAQTSFLSLRSPTPVENDAQVQTSFMELPREAEAQVQTSLLSLPGEKEAHAQTSFSSLQERKSVASFAGSVQSSSSYLELLEKFASLPMLSEAQVQTSHVDIRVPSEIDIHVQTSFSDYMSEREYASSSEPQSKLSPQSSVIEPSTVYPVYIDTGVQTLPVEIPPGNDWRAARLNTAAQVQTSFTSMIDEPQEPPPKFALEREESTRELESPFAIVEGPRPSELTASAIQTSDSLLQQWKKWNSLRPQADAQVQTSTIELLKKLSLLSRIQSMEAASRAELLKKASSLSVAEPQSQTSSPELLRKASSWSNTGVPDRILSDELLKRRPSSAQVLTMPDYASARLSPKLSTKEAQIQTSDVELLKTHSLGALDRSTDTLFRKSSSASYLKPQERTSDINFPKSFSASFAKSPEKVLDPDFQSYSSMSHAEPQKRVSDTDFQKFSSLSLIEGGDDNQEAITEGKEHLITPQVMEAQIRKWYHELPEVQTSASQKEPLWTPTADSEVQTSYVEIPYGNKWRQSRLQTEAQVQTSGLKVPMEEAECLPQSQKANQTQTSLLDIWRAREIAEAQNQTSRFDIGEIDESPPLLLIDSHVQTSDFDIWRAKEQMDGHTQTSVSKFPTQGVRSSPTEQVDKLVQTSFPDIMKAKDSMQQMASETELPEPEGERSSPLHFEEEADTQAQRSFSDFLEAQKEPSLMQQTDAGVQTSNVDLPMGSSWRVSRLHSDVQQQTSLEFDEENLETLPPSQKDIQSQTSLLDIWKAKELQNAQNQTSWMDFSTDVEDPFFSPQSESPSEFFMPETDQSPPPAQMDAQMQTSLLDIWKAKELNNALMQTSWIDVSRPMEEPFLPPQSESPIEPPMLEILETPPPANIDTQVQTSFPDIWRKKEQADAKMQSSLPYLPKKERADAEVQSSLPYLPKKERVDADVQSSLPDLPKEERADAEVQSSLPDLPKEERADAEVQSSLPYLPKEEQADSEVQSSLPYLPKEERADAEVQSSLPDLPKEERADSDVQSSLPDLPKEERADSEVQSSLPYLPKEERADSEVQSSLPDLPKEERADAEVQSSLPDLPKKEQVDAEVQSSLPYLPKVTKVVPLIPQAESPVQPPMPDSVAAIPELPSPGPGQPEEPTSITEMPEAMEPVDVPKSSPPSPPSGSKDQSSQVDMQTPEELSAVQEQSSRTSLASAKVATPVSTQTAVSPVSSHTTLGAVPSITAVSPVSSLMAVSPVPSLMAVSPTLSRTALSPVSSRTAVSPTLSRTAVSPVPSRTAVSPITVSPAPCRTAVSPILSCTAVSPVPSHTAASPMALSPVPSHTAVSPSLPPTAGSPVPSHTAASPTLSRTTVSPVPSHTAASPSLPPTAGSPVPSHTAASPTLPPAAGSPAPSHIPASPAPSEVPSPVRPSSPVLLDAKEQSALLEQNRAAMEKTLLELWTSREEAEVQKQTDQLQLHLEDLPLFPKLEDSQVEIADVMKTEGKKPNQVPMKSQAPVFAEAQVQTSFVEIPRGKKWRTSRICAEAQVQTSFQDLRAKDKVPTLHDQVAPKRVPRGPKRAAPMSVHLHVKMSPKRQTSNEKK